MNQKGHTDDNDGWRKVSYKRRNALASERKLTWDAAKGNGRSGDAEEGRSTFFFIKILEIFGAK